MSQALRKITGSVSKSHTSIIFINQIRMKIGVMFGNPETTTGGNALKFYASLRLEIRNAGKIEVTTEYGKESVGAKAKVKVVKNKIAPPFKVAEFDIMYNQGISYEGDLIDLATKYNLVRKAGAYFSYKDQTIGQGRENAKDFLKADPKMTQELAAEVMEQARAA